MLDSTKVSIAIGTILLRIAIHFSQCAALCSSASNHATDCVDRGCTLRIVARFFQKVSSDSTPPNNVVKIVESASRMCPARCAVDGIQMHELNSVFPASVKGCGLSRSMGCCVRTWTDLESSPVSA